ncbi:MAG: hypothetical protein KDI09_11985, partial [Halioglobus sp.]|nr:hypothetical protein [Halioglobus sp.]
PVGELLRTDQLVHALKEDFTLLRPTARLLLDCDPAVESRLLKVDNTLRQALLNLLNNAADVSPGQVSLHAGWQDDCVVLDILDRGPGLQRGPGVAGSTGMGIGLLLANASIERASGSVYATHRDGGGTLVRVTLPVASPVGIPV